MVQSLTTYSDKRKKNAEKIIKETGIISQLKLFGEVIVIGSFSNNTMIKPDIDLVVKIKNKKDVIKTISFIKKFIKKHSKFYGEWTEDRSSLSGESIHVYYKDKLTWKFDILITTTLNKKDLALKKKIIQAALNKNVRENILKLKYYFYKRKMRLNGLSMYIYEAVIDKKIEKISDFKKYLAKKGVKAGDWKK